MTIAYRPAELDDAPFVVSTWSRTFKASRSAGMIATEDWPRVMHEQIQKVLSRSDVQTTIAFENTDPAFTYGWIASSPAASPAVVFFVYVKESFRRAGYARGLFAAAGIDPRARFVYTCWMPIAAKLATKIPLAKHDPNFARIPGYVEHEPRSATWRR